MQDILEQATQWFGKVAEFEQTQNKMLPTLHDQKQRVATEMVFRAVTVNRFNWLN